MKKMFFLLAFLGISTYSYTYSGGSPSGNSGSLGDNGSTCASAYCHGGGSSTGNELISITAPTDSIYDGNDITIALGVKPNGSSTKVGFMASVEDASGNQLATSSPGTGAKNVGDYITHTSSGTTVSNDSIFWTFNVDGTTFPDSITVYAAVNFTNGNGQTSGDYVLTTSKSFYKGGGMPFELTESAVSTLLVGPNPARDRLSVSSPDVVEVRLYNTLGRFIDMDQSAIVQDNAIELEVSSLPRGAYILHAINSSGEVQMKHVLLQ